MAQKEIIRADYDSIKASLESGQSINQVSKAFKLGNRRVSMIASSKSYTSYIAKRAYERRKRAENTPAKAVAGAHELQQPAPQYAPGEEKAKQEIQEYLDENGQGVPMDGEAAEETGRDYELEKMQRGVNEYKLMQAQRRREVAIGMVIILIAFVAVVCLIVWGVSALLNLTR